MSKAVAHVVRKAGIALAVIIISSVCLFGQQQPPVQSSETAANARASAPDPTEVPGRSGVDAKPAKVAASPTKVPALDSSYRIGIQDSLMISVWHEPEMSMPVVVRPDGMITLPLLNDLKVVGLTTKELQDLLTEKLKPFIADPQVTIIVQNINSRVVYLAGQVGHVGAVPLNSRKTVLEMLLEAGGPGPFAKTESIYVLRKVNGETERLPFKYKRALKGDRKDDFPLLPGDIIVVP